MPIIDVAVREGHAAIGVEVAGAAAVLEVRDGEAGADLLGGAGDADDARLGEADGGAGDGGGEALRSGAEDGGGGG